MIKFSKERKGLMNKNELLNFDTSSIPKWKLTSINILKKALLGLVVWKYWSIVPLQYFMLLLFLEFGIPKLTDSSSYRKARKLGFDIREAQKIAERHSEALEERIGRDEKRELLRRLLENGKPEKKIPYALRRRIEKASLKMSEIDAGKLWKAKSISQLEYLLTFYIPYSLLPLVVFFVTADIVQISRLDWIIWMPLGFFALKNLLIWNLFPAAYLNLPGLSFRMKVRAGTRIRREMEKYGLTAKQTGKLGGYYLDRYRRMQEREKKKKFSEVLTKYGVQDVPEQLNIEK